MKGIESFEIFDRVLWNDGDPLISLLIAEMVKEHGSGPFTVMGVGEIPADLCACGLPRGHSKHDFALFEDICAQSMRKISGHHQRVRVMDSSAKMVGSVRFSGAWFKKIVL